MPSLASLSLAPNAAATFDVDYSTIDPVDAKTTGASIRMHYDSSELTPDLAAINASAFAGATVQDAVDSSDFDGDAETDRFVNFLWFDADGDFPSVANLPITLFSAAFTATGSFNRSTINFSGSPPAGFDLSSTPVQLNVSDGTNTAPVANNDSGTTTQNVTLNVDANSGLVSNDTDADGDLLIVTQFTVAGTSHDAGTTASLAEGDLTINADGSFAFVPTVDFNGGVPVATYTVSDGAATDSATLTLTVTDATAAPTVTISPNAVSTTDNPISFIFEFSEPVTGFELSDVQVSNGTTRRLSVLGESSYAVTVVPADMGDVTISIPDGAVSNAGGSGNLEATASVFSNTTSQGSPPTLDAPVIERVERRPTLSWSAVSEATTYEIWLARVSPAESRILVTESIVSTNEWTPADDLAPAFHRFWVRSIDENGIAGPWSNSAQFDIKPTLVGPFDGTFNRRPNFEWEAIPSATGYQIFIRTQDENFGTDGDFVVSNIPTSQLTFSPDTDLPDGRFRWWIRAQNSVANRGWSEPGETNVYGRTSLLQGTTNQIIWQSVAGAGRYILHVEDSAGNVVIREDHVSGTSFVLSTSLATDNYRAWVKAIDASTDSFQTGKWSRGFDFTVAASEPAQSAFNSIVSALTVLSQDDAEVPVAGQHEKAQPVPATDKPEPSNNADETAAIDLYMATESTLDEFLSELG